MAGYRESKDNFPAGSFQVKQKYTFLQRDYKLKYSSRDSLRKIRSCCSFLAAMRERYQKHGALLELSREMKADLGLVEPSHWTLERLISVQAKIVEPLLLYW